MIAPLLKKLREKLRPPSPLATADYVADGLAVWNKTVGFLHDPAFIRAYDRGANSGHKLAGPREKNKKLHIEWRAHIAVTMVHHALHLEGDFVECGVNTGVLSLAICEALEFNRHNKRFFLFDTFSGIPEEQISEEEKQQGRLKENSLYYEECYERTKSNFTDFSRAILVRGRVPEILPSAKIEKVCYLSLDMNIAEPELAALEYFWDKLTPGAPILMDDYGWKPYLPQKRALDEFAASRGVAICELPTGQGLLLRPLGN
jgi:O-methyltransferase